MCIRDRGDDVGDVGGGAMGAGDAAAADALLEEQGHGLLDSGDGVAGGSVVAVQRPVEQSVPEGCGVGVLAQDLGGIGGGQRFGHPRQDVLEAAPGQRGGVEVALQHLGGLGRVEAGRVVGVPAGDGALDGAGGERLGASFGDQGVDAALDLSLIHIRCV